MMMYEDVHRVGKMLSRPLRWQLFGILLLTLCSAVAEMVTIGTIVPFLALLATPGVRSPIAKLPVLAELGSSENLLPVALGLIGLALLSTTVRLALAWRAQQFAARFGVTLVHEIYSGVLHEALAAFEERHSSEIVSGIERVQEMTYGFVRPLIQAVTSGIVAVFIAVFLVALSPLVALLAGGMVLFVYFVMTALILPRVRRNASRIGGAVAARAKILHESLRAKREIMLDHSQEHFAARLRLHDSDYRAAMAANAMFAQSPRMIFEGVAIVGVVVVALLMVVMRQDLVAALPLLGALAIGIQRLLPLVQTVWSGVSQAAGHRTLVRDVLKLHGAFRCGVALPRPRHCLEREIRFEGVAYRHARTGFAVEDITFSIRRGEWIALQGPSGSGKTTILDLVTGLRVPVSGTILLDGSNLDGARLSAWRRSVAYVANGSPLIDDTVIANVCHGQPEGAWDMRRTRHVLSLVGLDAFAAGLPQGLDTRIGEDGTIISAGQRQRLAIARALYKQPELLVLDEATSAIDVAAEARIFEALARECPNLTLIVVSHRSSSVHRCSRQLALRAGGLLEQAPERFVLGGARLQSQSRHCHSG